MFTPFVKYESRNVNDTFATTAANQDEHRIQVGGTYYVMGHNLNLKAAYTRGSLDRAAGTPLTQLPSYTQNGFTMQLQAFYY